MSERTCAACLTPLTRSRNEKAHEWQTRRWCSRGCRWDQLTGNRLDDLLWLIDSGEPWASIPNRLGTTPLALSRWLRRNGEPQLASRFKRVDIVRAA